MKKNTICFVSMLFVAACMTLPTSSEYVARGDGYVKDNKFDKAIAAYNKALQLNPGNLEARSSRGVTHYFAGHYALAQQDFEYVLTKNPYHTDAYSAYGSTLAARGDFKNALEVLDRAIAAEPNKPENYVSRAGVYFMLGKYEDAVKNYTAVLEAFPAAEVFSARGAAYLQMGKKELAEQDFQTAKSGKYPATLSVYAELK